VAHPEGFLGLYEDIAGVSAPLVGGAHVVDSSDVERVKPPA